MTKEEFERVASRLGAEAREHPRRYRARVLAFGALGYAYVFVVMAALLAVVIALGWRIAREGDAGAHALAKLAISAAILWVAVLKSIWVRIDPPVGTELRPEEAPQLFADVEAIRRLLKVPPIHRTLVTDELNASVAQIPRLGFLGWHRNYLVLGAPLMRALRPAEFRGVLAHELGHLSRAHGRMSAWAYRVRERWSRVLTELERSGSWLKVVFERFFEWYAPRFAAYTFALSRAYEFEADRAAARIVGRAAYTSALKRLAIAERILAGHWSAVWSRTATEPTPPAEVYAAFHARLADPVAPAEAAEWLPRLSRNGPRASTRTRRSRSGSRRPATRIRPPFRTGQCLREAARPTTIWVSTQSASPHSTRRSGGALWRITGAPFTPKPYAARRAWPSSMHWRLRGR